MAKRILIGFFLCVALLKAGFSVEAADEKLVIDSSALPAIACHFESRITLAEKTVQPQARGWYFWREPARIETRSTTGEAGQIWELSPKEQVSYQRIFRDAKRVIEYTSGALRSLGEAPEWRKIASLIDPALIGFELKGGEEIEVLGRRAYRYVGQVDGQELEVWWLAHEGIPARLRQTGKNYEEVMQLKELHALSQAPWLRNETAGYELIDYADLGDKESDPFVRALLHGQTLPHGH
ncbi:MAG: hypothetical protein HYZ50_13290 [Deltaproteobacteria bacterium]|nr:hypothetical protein [Deltaproteobacteria bacterium]